MKFSHEQTLEMTKGGFFGEGNAQWPNSHMLMIDEITNINDNGGSFLERPA